MELFLHLASLKAKIIEVVADGLQSCVAKANSLSFAVLKHADRGKGVEVVHFLCMLMLLKFNEYITVLLHLLVQ